MRCKTYTCNIGPCELNVWGFVNIEASYRSKSANIYMVVNFSTGDNFLKCSDSGFTNVSCSKKNFLLNAQKLQNTVMFLYNQEALLSILKFWVFICTTTLFNNCFLSFSYNLHFVREMEWVLQFVHVAFSTKSISPLCLPQILFIDHYVLIHNQHIAHCKLNVSKDRYFSLL